MAIELGTLECWFEGLRQAGYKVVSTKAEPKKNAYEWKIATAGMRVPCTVTYRPREPHHVHVSLLVSVDQPTCEKLGNELKMDEIFARHGVQGELFEETLTNPEGLSEHHGYAGPLVLLAIPVTMSPTLLGPVVERLSAALREFSRECGLPESAA